MHTHMVTARSGVGWFIVEFAYIPFTDHICVWKTLLLCRSGRWTQEESEWLIAEEIKQIHLQHIHTGTSWSPFSSMGPDLCLFTRALYPPLLPWSIHQRNGSRITRLGVESSVQLDMSHEGVLRISHMTPHTMNSYLLMCMGLTQFL